MRKGYLSALSQGTSHGYDWYVGHNHLGYRTGYVRLNHGHPWFMQPYAQLNAIVDVHGGLTYAEKGPVGRVPNFSYQWWIGFDCAHCDDAPELALVAPEVVAAWAALNNSLADNDLGFDMMDILTGGGVIRDTPYVESECISLCQQAKAAADSA